MLRSFYFDLLRFKLFDVPTLPAAADPRGRACLKLSRREWEQSAFLFSVLYPYRAKTGFTDAIRSRARVRKRGCYALDDFRSSSDFVVSGPRSAFRWNVNQPALGCRVGGPGHSTERTASYGLKKVCASLAPGRRCGLLALFFSVAC